MYESPTTHYNFCIKWVVGRNHIMNYHFFSTNAFNILLPIFRSIPTFDVGMPVTLAIFCLAFVMPSARFSEKVSPGIEVEFLFIAYVL